VNLPIPSKIGRIRLACLLTITAGSLLSAGCARGPRAGLAQMFGEAGGAIKQAAGKVPDVFAVTRARTEAELPADGPDGKAGEAGIQVASADEAGDTDRSILQAGKVLAVFSRQNSDEDDPSEDPFASALAVHEDLKQNDTAAVPASFAAQQPATGADEESELELIESIWGEPQATNSDASPTAQSAAFESGFDSQMDRVRALMDEAVDAAETPLFQPLRAEEVRSEVTEQMQLAKSRQQLGDLETAVAMAIKAQALAQDANLFFGPNEEKPSELVAVLQDLVSKQPQPSAVLEQPSALPVGEESPKSIEKPTTHAFEPKSPFEGDFEPKYESTPFDSPHNLDSSLPEIQSVSASDTAAAMAPNRGFGGSGFEGMIVPGDRQVIVFEAEARPSNTGSVLLPEGRSAAEPGRNLVTLGAPIIEEIDGADDPGDAGLVPAVLMVPDAVGDTMFSATQTAELPQPNLAEAPLSAPAPPVPSYVTALEPIDWELEPTLGPETFDEGKLPIWVGTGLAILALLGLRSFRRNRRIARA